MKAQDHAAAIVKEVDAATAAPKIDRDTLMGVHMALAKARTFAVGVGGADGEQAAIELDYADVLYKAYERTVTTAKPKAPERRIQHVSRQVLALSRAVSQTNEAVLTLGRITN
ncbi:hypothetical protein [Brevibacterium sp. SMBL_HHYL_HB1]|uniref:hypothetical protein n=1 Tax=Brevibacterium sp. SMBL_HHYL_HB1 TaxID=2777556 RepID=UPI001BAD4EFC|nr:hypothetical protein [Brevibacterium sp. SMBL_HHYL_HB1]QUL79938.1 hypothetical protein IG171_03600 [Brevibacterium sp. SMBL_HHYL_HB1]